MDSVMTMKGLMGAMPLQNFWARTDPGYDDTTTHSTTTEVIEITICVQFDCNTTTIRLRRIARACFHSTRFVGSKK